MGGGPHESKNGDIIYSENVMQMIARLDVLITTTLVQEKRNAGKPPTRWCKGRNASLIYTHSPPESVTLDPNSAYAKAPTGNI